MLFPTQSDGRSRGRRRVLVVAVALWVLGALGALAQPRPEAAKDAGVADAAVEEASKPSSADAYRPAPSEHEGAPARTLHIEAERGAKVLRVPVEGTIDLGLAAFIRRALDVDAREVAAIVLDVNTLGGRVDAAIQIRDALLDSPVKTVAYVHPRAISAGALISLACDFLVVAPGATLGAATPIQMGQGGAQPVEEKMVSYFRAEMRSTAESKGRRGDIAEAMVDSSVEIEDLSQAGKLVTLDTAGALKWAMADFSAESLSELLQGLGLEHPVVVEADENWAEDIVRFLTDPVVSGLLMSLGTLGILMELYTPGLGLPGALGTLCLLLFFGGHLLVNLVGIEEILLFAAGLVLLAAEIFVIPGFGVAGILGIGAVVMSLLLTLVGLPLTVTFTTGAWVEPLERVVGAMAMTFLGALVALRFLPRTTAGRRLVLDTVTDRAAGFVSSQSVDDLMGKRGVAASDLRPAGIATVDGQRHDVVTQGDYVSAGTPLRVVQVEGARVVVVVDDTAESSG